MQKGERVKLRSWEGRQSPPYEGVLPYDNYWLLIGYTGVVIENEETYYQKVNPKRTQARVLVRFDVNVNGLGLASHNEMSDPGWGNSLWVLSNDLLIIGGNEEFPSDSEV